MSTDSPAAAVSNTRVGAILSLIGGVVGLAAVIAIFLSAVPGFSGLVAAPGILILFAICGLIPGEQLRRGRISGNPDAPKTRLPKASNISRFRMLGTGWHVLWICVGLVISIVLVGVPVRGWFVSGFSGEDLASGFWVVYGSVAFGITVASMASLGKKLTWRRRVEAGRAATSGQPFWRWVTYRMRLDIWAAGVGGLLIAISPTFIAADLGPYPDQYRLQTDLPTMIIVVAIGFLLVIAGAAASANFWRAGVDLGGGESFS